MVKFSNYKVMVMLNTNHQSADRQLGCEGCINVTQDAGIRDKELTLRLGGALLLG